ncbi:MAG: LAGLIDADG family homing endonuclease [Thaumarchaeota archaeon]|nr:LAGLIDADG family homing endonuclease [Nitrososphaerota archaeon]
MSASQEGSAPKLAWPPTEHDLQRLYLEEQLSAAKIAKVYGRNTKNPRSAAFLITYYLKKYGIERRDRVEELRKDTEAIVEAWKAKHPKVEDGEAPGPVEADDPRLLTDEEGAVIELLQNKDLSIRHLDPETKARVRTAMEGLHWTRGLSLNDIAGLAGNKTSGYSSYLFKELELKARPFEEARLKGVANHLRKYERRPFDGTDEDKAYMLGLKHGDLSAYVPFRNVTRVSTSTTHPALAELFTDLFGLYGHVYKHPRHKKDSNTYEWNFQAILDKSFGFLLESRDECREWVAIKEITMLAYLAGLVDAEGYIRIYPNPQTVGISVTIYNTDSELVEFAYDCLKQLGSNPSEPYLEKRGGYVSTKGFKILLRRDYWRVMVARFNEAQSLLDRMPLRHQEKVARKEVALSVVKGDLYEKLAETISRLQRDFDEEVAQFTKQAEVEYRLTHPE